MELYLGQIIHLILTNEDITRAVRYCVNGGHGASEAIVFVREVEAQLKERTHA